ncbi:MAG TPA: hypothetical protein VFD37_05590 [Solirubrobacterales bacterium]|nr:hypothetical protein [Solirubrobacterales bacterium]
MFSKLRIAMTLLGAGLILALPTQAVANPVPDPRGDVVNPGERDTADYDIVLARSVTRGDKLIYMVKLAGTPEVGDDHTVFGTGIQIEINTESSRPGDCHRSSRDPLGRAEYILDTHGNPSLVDCRVSGIPELEMIQVRKRPGALLLIVNRAQIGNPARYSWFASSGQTRDTSDLAPNADPSGNPTYAVHKVQAPRPAGKWRKCGDLQESGAGAFNVMARSIGCRPARRVADSYTWSKGNLAQAGWTCRTRRVGYELSKAQCVKRGQRPAKIVRFEIGA